VGSGFGGCSGGGGCATEEVVGGRGCGCGCGNRGGRLC